MNVLLKSTVSSKAKEFIIASEVSEASARVWFLVNHMIAVFYCVVRVVEG